VAAKFDRSVSLRRPNSDNSGPISTRMTLATVAVYGGDMIIRHDEMRKTASGY